jgi:SAM-dependent methyltransferase
VPELDAAEANRRFYRTIAAEYDEKELAVSNVRARALLERLLRRALSLLGPSPAALDACGGSGNVSQLLVRMGARPVLVDVSPEMIALWRRKAELLGVEGEAVESEILDFLLADARTWDLIVFSSALHHLEDYERVVGAALARVRPGGVLVTVFDPPLSGQGDRLLRRLDWVLFQAFHEPRDFMTTLRGRFRRSIANERPIGRLAERYALEGVDDLALCRLLESQGFEIVEHERRADARLAVVRALLRILRRSGAFHLIARRRPLADQHATTLDPSAAEREDETIRGAVE